MNSLMKAFPTATSAGRDLVKYAAVQIFELPERGLDALVRWQHRLEARQSLARADSRLLDDMGINPEDAAREGAKPFWRA